MARRQSQVSDLFPFSSDLQPSPQQLSMAPPPPQPTLFGSSHPIGSNPVALPPLPLELSHPPSCLKSSPSSVYRHHRHHSNASEASSASPFPDRPPHDHLSHRPTASPAPSFEDLSTGCSPFVDEPLPMEGEFATMDLQSSSSPSMINHFLPRPPSNVTVDDRQHFRYDTLTWAKEHPLPEPQDAILATGGLHPKTSISSLTAMLESHPHHHLDPSTNPSFQLLQHPSNSSSSSSSSSSGASNPHHHLNSFPLDQLVSHSPADRSDSPGKDPAGSNSYPSAPPNHDSQLPTISLPSLTSNPNSPLPRLDMNHPAMPTGPRISLTSATPLTAKPSQQLSGFFQSINGSTSLAGPSQNLELSPSKSLFESFIPHPLPASLQSMNQSNSFLGPRPIRGRQRSKSESMGKHHHSISMTSDFDSLSLKSLLANPPTCPPPVTEFSPVSLCPLTPSTASLPYLYHPDLSSEFRSVHHNTTDPSHLTSSSQLCPSDGQAQIFQNISEDTSFLQRLLENLDRKTRRPGGPDYDVSFLKPQLHSHHRRSHSVSHGHHRGRSEGHIPGFPFLADHQSSIQNFLSIPLNLPTSASSSSSPPARVDPSDSNNSSAITQQTPSDSQPSVNISNSDWLSSFSIDGPSVTYNPNESWPQQTYSPAPADACLSSSRPRSYSHSSFESEEAGASESPTAPPIEYRSRTTAATKAAAVKRRKEGVAARYICEMCGETFTRRYNLRGHQRAHKGEKPFACGFPGCNSRFARAHDQKRHYKLHLGVKDYSCPVCRKTFIRLDALQRHHKSDAGQACFHQLQMSGKLSQDYGTLSSSVGDYTSGSSASFLYQSDQNSESSGTMISNPASIMKDEPCISSDHSYQSQLTQSSRHLSDNINNGMSELDTRLGGNNAENCDMNNHFYAQLGQQQNPQSLQFLNPQHHEL